ncbi:DUF3280 domain-containing protein [Spectribacter hydrogenoxidans]|uniref:DUF3280 domain-containing protein n=1 Tax=Spectribacter hydrogenoxidans TaxID=3075608 RepID=A0ABU3BYM3_9GAMM|nr:DUF3280 domain-containing protein [Salinisphaera sp. W335]MDT0634393.1 DUF3280 domain-containing protein [Salinisphaera sp. W335]
MAVLPFDLVDTSLQADLEGRQPEDLARVRRATARARTLLAELPAFCPVDVAPASSAIDRARERYRYLHRCNGCELGIASQLNAELVLVGWAQKVSSLILNINAVIREVDTGIDLAGGSVDMRSNTDEAWRRATRTLVSDILRRSYNATVSKVQSPEAAKSTIPRRIELTSRANPTAPSAASASGSR